jgi:hypothetical protein
MVKTIVPATPQGTCFEWLSREWMGKAVVVVRFDVFFSKEVREGFSSFPSGTSVHVTPCLQVGSVRPGHLGSLPISGNAKLKRWRLSGVNGRRM